MELVVYIVVYGFILYALVRLPLIFIADWREKRRIERMAAHRVTKL